MSNLFYNLPISDLEEIKHNLSDISQEFSGEDVLILGGAGALGTAVKVFLLYLNKYVLLEPMRIVSVDNYIGRPKPLQIDDSNLLNIEHDLILPLDEKVFGYRFSFMFNMSGNAAPTSGYGRFPIETMDVSYLGVKNLLRLAMQHNAKIINMSSSEVVGSVPLNELPSDENIIPRLHTMNLRSCYDLFKAAGVETQSYVYKEKFGLDVKVVRPFNVQYYYRQGDSRVIAAFIERLLKNEKMSVYMPSTQTRTFVFWTDFLTGIIRVLLNGKQFLYNVGREDEMITIKELAIKLENISGKNNMIELVEAPTIFKHEPQYRQPSIKRINLELGYSAKVNLDEILKRMYFWAKENYKF